MSNSIEVFRPFAAGTVTIAATAASANVQFHNAGMQRNAELNVVLYNSGAAAIFVEFGASAVAATTPSGATKGSMPVAPGATVNVRVSSSIEYVAAITGTNGTIYITPGQGL